MKRLFYILGVVCTLAAGASATAQNAPTNAFTAVDSVNSYGSSLYITGVLDGASGPTEVQLNFSSNASGQNSCERYALLSMEKRGRYRLEYWVGPTYGSAHCRLSLVNP